MDLKNYKEETTVAFDAKHMQQENATCQDFLQNQPQQKSVIASPKDIERLNDCRTNMDEDKERCAIFAIHNGKMCLCMWGQCYEFEKGIRGYIRWPNKMDLVCMNAVKELALYFLPNGKMLICAPEGLWSSGFKKDNSWNGFLFLFAEGNDRELFVLDAGKEDCKPVLTNCKVDCCNEDDSIDKRIAEHIVYSIEQGFFCKISHAER